LRQTPVPAKENNQAGGWVDSTPRSKNQKYTRDTKRTPPENHAKRGKGQTKKGGASKTMVLWEYTTHGRKDGRRSRQMDPRGRPEDVLVNICSIRKWLHNPRKGRS